MAKKPTKKRSKVFFLVKNDDAFGDISVYAKRPEVCVDDYGDKYIDMADETSVCTVGFEAIAGKRFLPKPFQVVKVRLVVEA